MLKRTPKGKRQRSRRNDPQRTRQDIIDIATDEFASHGYSGARVDAIAARTNTSKRMIYYYFGGKEQLYLAVLETAYRNIREAESKLDLGSLPPRDAIRRLIEATFDHDENNPNFIRLVSIENIHRGKHLTRLPILQELNANAIGTISDILERGRRDGVFRRDVDPVDLHMAISSFCFFRVANRHTFGSIFGRDLAAPELRATHKRQICEMILAYLATASAESD
jgi:AcrR family transcriptional regulator